LSVSYLEIFISLISFKINNLKYIKANKFIVLVLILVHLIFFVTKVIIGDFYLRDSYEYWYLAENITNHFTFYSADLNNTIYLGDYTRRPPLYGVFIVVFSFLLQSKIMVLLTQNVLSFLSILITLNIFNTSHNKKTTNLYLILIVTSISQFIYANLLMSEILLQFLIVLLCLTFHLVITKKTLKSLMCFELIIVLLFLTKPIFYLFVFPNILIGFWFSKHIKRAYLLSLIPLISLILYVSWNYKRTGSFEFSSIQNLSLKNYNLKYFHIKKYGEEYALKVNAEIDHKAKKATSYAEKEKIIQSQTIGYIKKDFFNYMLFHIKSGFIIFIDPGRFDLYNYFNFNKKMQIGFLYYYNKSGITGIYTYFKEQPLLIIILLPMLLILNIIKGIGFILYWLKNYKNTPPLLWFAIFIILYISSLTGAVGSSRFLVPVLPIYCMFAALGFTHTVYKLKPITKFNS